MECVRGEHVRYVLRDTLEYYQALTEALGPGVTGNVILGSLPSFRALFSSLEKDEVSSLERLDIPRFTLPTASRDLAGLKDCFAVSGYDLACQALKRLSEEDMQQQVAFIKLAWSFYRVSRSLS
jgi:lantibiotic modifying enzyme